jgi:(R,R)-butanediol dehydrogenase/meso-butanediol dehydrogenase/diacetyl reductase
MKAAVFTGFGRPLSIAGVPEPTPGKDDVIVRVARCGICGSDLAITSEPIFAAQPGMILGHEYTGEVVELGSKVTTVRKGDRVTVMPIRSCGHCANCKAGEFAWCSAMRLEGGGYAELSAASAIQCTRLPMTVSLQDGALVEPLAVGLHAVEVSQMTAGARVLVVGAGPIGLATAFWARRLGASRIVVTARSATQSQRSLEMGATSFVKLEPDPNASFQSALGGPPDIVYECVGKPGVLEACIGYVRPRGTVVVVGLCTARDSFVPFMAVSKEVRIQCAAFYNLRDFEICADALDRDAAAASAMVTDVVSLDAMPAAFEALRTRTSQCKVAVEP